ncbi:MAG: DUF1080 domain-containing protein [Rhodothermia bacterium]|nr:MAG: DUF1080 domain-containing protein [Rhodothermia bacterium]
MTFYKFLLISLSVIFAACAESDSESDSPEAAPETSSDWQVLFDGSSMDQWRGYQQESMAPGWEIVDGAMTLTAPSREGDIVTVEQYSNFEFEFEWMVPTEGNSGVMFRVTEDHDAPYETGPEYQILDDANHTDGQTSKNSAASNYNIHPPSANVVKAAGEWNTGRIVADGPHIEHWLNGEKVVEYELWTDQWKADVAASKWIDYPDYGLRESGYIALQGDHTSVSYRNMRIRIL